MAEPFLGEIKICSFNFPPQGWAFCDGQFLPISQNQALFSILGTTYGGNGQTTFALPNLSGRSPIHVGQGVGLGQLGGETAHTLTVSELPMHNHTPMGSSATATLASPFGNVWAQASQNPFAAVPNTAMNPSCITVTGGGQPHENMSPYLVLCFVIALSGIFPSTN